MPEIRTGIDLCEIARMEKAAPHFLARVFTPEELAYADGRGAMRAAALAGMWAAKEAFCKALGTGIAFPLTGVEITHAPGGAPAYRLHGEAAAHAPGASLSLSVTHEGGMAAAVCVMVTADSPS